MRNFIIIIDEKHDLIPINVNLLQQHIIYIIDEEQVLTNIEH
jgi:hypothetical protein